MSGNYNTIPDPVLEGHIAKLARQVHLLEMQVVKLQKTVARMIEMKHSPYPTVTGGRTSDDAYYNHVLDDLQRVDEE